MSTPDQPDQQRIRQRANLLPEEQHPGDTDYADQTEVVPDEETAESMAEEVLRESEERASHAETDRARTSAPIERRRRPDTE
ncbi:hypothetical protein [Sciscionella marina]|uniref:hypothetical protein n=1 Tax=Sciscionella marina TaxID=508770 RepID=UPI0012F67235|nr:hypothetical protein [Sciscionella marina]